ncbi:MAG: hypothetical protein IKG95_07525 [Bacteroidales bacterium]|nr:hypothetical protein [Bacteroidales bacterium]
MNSCYTYYLCSSELQILLVKVLEVGWSSNRRMRFDYGYDHQRIRVVTDRNMPPIHKTYIGNCERIDALSKSPAYRTYLSGPLGVFAVVSQTGGEVDSVTYVLKDHLGSWTVFADGDGDLVREESYDAWGNRRNPATWTGPATGSLLFQRGFTGHEHMEYTGLINMNGRLYDPVMSTFLSVDSYVQEPDFSQSFNRYAYCLNNPLRYVDPDGNLFWIIPNIGWSKEGGWSFGLTFAFGIPGVWCTHASVGYSVGSQAIYANAGVTVAGITGYVSVGYSFKNDQVFSSIGITAGLSPYSGVPVSTNFLTVGASCDLTYSKAAGYDVSFTGNLSAWSYNTSAKAWNFNPSVSVMVYPEHTTNLVRGQGFRSNDAVLKRFVAANNHQGALDYFGFEGKYTPGKYDNDAWYGTESGIHYSDGAFTSYDDLFSSYTKESFEQQRHRTNTWAEASNPTGIPELDRWLAEYEGHLWQYQNQGLYRNTTIDLSLCLDNCINEMIRINSWFDKPVYGTVPSFNKAWWHFIYRIPRLY